MKAWHLVRRIGCTVYTLGQFSPPMRTEFSPKVKRVKTKTNSLDVLFVGKIFCHRKMFARRIEMFKYLVFLTHVRPKGPWGSTGGWLVWEINPTRRCPCCSFEGGLWSSLDHNAAATPRLPSIFHNLCGLHFTSLLTPHAIKWFLKCCLFYAQRVMWWRWREE